MLDEPQCSTVVMTCADDEDTLFTLVARSTGLQQLVWTNCSPLAEAAVNVLDVRPLLSALGHGHVALAHLDLSGIRLDIPSNRRALITKLPQLPSLSHLSLRHASLVLRDSEGAEGSGPQQACADCGPRELLQAIAAHAPLASLDLSGNKISVEGCGILEQSASSGGLANLQSLRLRGAHLDDACAQQLARMLHHLHHRQGRAIQLAVAHHDFTYFGERTLRAASSSVVFDADRAWILESALRDWTVLQCHSSPWSSDKALMLAVVQCWWEALAVASAELRDDEELFEACLKHHPEVGWRCLELAGDRLRQSRDVVLQACAMDIRALQYASEDLRCDKLFLLELVALDKQGVALKYAANTLKSDREVVFAAVRSNGKALGFAADELKSDKETVLAAVRSSFHALQFASPELKEDPKVRLRVCVCVCVCVWKLVCARANTSANLEKK